MGTATATNPVVERDLLLHDLRRLREESELTQPQVADKLGWRREKVGRIENGQMPVQDADLKDLLAVYGVTDDAAVASLLERAEVAREPGWAEYKDVLRRDYIKFLGYEEIASEMLQYHLSLIPGLLQTRSYMREIFTRVDEDAARNVRRLMEARTRRQQILTADRGPRFRIIIDEGALRRPVGSWALMRDQLEHLKTCNRMERVELRVMPFAAGPHPGMKGPFNLLRFEGTGVADMLYMESSHADTIDGDDRQVAAEYLQIFEDLVEMSLGADKFDAFVDSVLAKIPE